MHRTSNTTLGRLIYLHPAPAQTRTDGGDISYIVWCLASDHEAIQNCPFDPSTR